MHIRRLYARQIIDSRGNPTVEAEVTLEDGHMGRAAVPSGASTGSHEAHEMRDGGPAFDGKGVAKAVKNVNSTIRQELLGDNALDQSAIDARLIQLDGSDDKSTLGANALLAVSLAIAKAAAHSQGKALYAYVQELHSSATPILPMPMINIINGGKHAAGSTDIQEFMIVPSRARTMTEAVRMGAEIFHALGRVLEKEGYATTVGDEGGYAPHVKNGNAEALDLIMKAIESSGYSPGSDVHIALDVAASELLVDNAYHLATENQTLNADELTARYASLMKKYPIISIEDPLGEDDWESWIKMTAHADPSLQIVGDDLLVTNTSLLTKAITQKAANAILIKPNQIGTLTETIAAVSMAQEAGWNTIMSHRSGETEDTTIAHLAVGLGCGQIKTGSMSRSERVAKYNELLRISELVPELWHAKQLGV